VVPGHLARELLWRSDLDLYLSNLPSEMDRLHTAAGEGWYRYNWLDRFAGSLDMILVGPLGVFLMTLLWTVMVPQPITVIFSLFMLALVIVTFGGCLQHHSAPAGMIRTLSEDLDTVLGRVLAGITDDEWSMISPAVFHGPRFVGTILLSRTDDSHIFLMGDGDRTRVHVGPMKRASELADMVDGT